MRLDKYLQKIGYGTKEIVKTYIKNGDVSINDIVIFDASYKVNDIDIVKVNSSIKPFKKLVYLMINKPNGVLSVTKDKDYPTILSILPNEYHDINLSPVGRLDLDTTGLLILTNDTKVLRRIASPTYQVPKKYLVTFTGDSSLVDINKFNEGLTFENGYKTLPSKVDFFSKNQAYLIIYEGKYHQVKKMFESVHLKVVALKRISIGEISLDSSLNEGDYRELNKEEINSLKSH